MNAIAASVVFGVLAAVGWGIADFLAAFASKRLGVLRTATGVHLASSAVAAGYFFVVFDPAFLTWTHWAALAGVSVLGLLVYLVFYRALNEGTCCRSQPYSVLIRHCSHSACNAVHGRTAQRLAGRRSDMQHRRRRTGVVRSSIFFEYRQTYRVWRGAGNRYDAWHRRTEFRAGNTVQGAWVVSPGLYLGWFLPVYISRTLTLGWRHLFVNHISAQCSLSRGVMRQWTLRGVTPAYSSRREPAHRRTVGRCVAA